MYNFLVRLSGVEVRLSEVYPEELKGSQSLRQRTERALYLLELNLVTDSELLNISI